MKLVKSFFLLGVALLGLFGCQQDLGQRPPSDSAALCDNSARHYRDVTSGKELCDTQTLIASLSATVTDVQAGQGALHVPFRVTKREVRTYCFNDDNNERHKLVLRSDAGGEVLRLVAGESCKQATLEEGRYSIRFEHENVGGVDTDPDVIHTRMVQEGDSTVFHVDVNACPGCWLKNTDWPCHTVNPGTSKAYEACGFSGNYAKAYFDNVRCFGHTREHTECFLDGNFDGATFTFGSFLNDSSNDLELILGTASDAPPENPGTPRSPSSFAGTDFPYSFYAGSNLQGYRPRVTIRDVSRLTGDAFDLSRFAVVNASPNLEVERRFAGQFQIAPAFTGKPAWLSVSRTSMDFSNQRLDFARVFLLPELVNGVRSLQGANFENAELLNIAPIRTGDEAFLLGLTNFHNARISDSVIDATDIYAANFRGANLSNVQFVGSGKARIYAPEIHIEGATLTGVTFGAKSTADTSSFGADLTNLHADGVTLQNVYARNCALTRSRFVGAKIEGFTATGSDLSGSNFGELLSFTGATLSYSLVRPFAVDPPGAPVPFVLGLASSAAPIDALVLIGAVVDVNLSNKTLSRTNMSYATVAGNFADARISGSTFANAVISKQAVFTRARIENSQFNGAHIAGELDAATVSNSNFSGVTFVAANTTQTTFDGGDLSGAHFCGDGKYAATKFLRVGLAGLVMPLKGTTFPDAAVPLKPGEERCAGGITLAERNALVTSTANQCPDGSIPITQDCKDGQWTPMSSNVSPTCCMPTRGSSCDPFIPGHPCISDCQCASKRCIAGACGS